jgi:hypothetical protein
MRGRCVPAHDDARPSLELSHVRDRLTKLERSGYAERHLFLLADDSALPTSVVFGFLGSDAVPREPLEDLPPGLTLWLLVSIAGRVLVATRDGWTSHQGRPMG